VRGPICVHARLREIAQNKVTCRKCTRAASLEAAGLRQPEAERLANDDESLDRFIALAPLCAYGELAPERQAGVQSGSRLGSFPVPAHPSAGPYGLVRPSTDFDGCFSDRR
jgi:hypothetical protein